jgi:hypothetical protein
MKNALAIFLSLFYLMSLNGQNYANWSFTPGIGVRGFVHNYKKFRSYNFAISVSGLVNYTPNNRFFVSGGAQYSLSFLKNNLGTKVFINKGNEYNAYQFASWVLMPGFLRAPEVAHPQQILPEQFVNAITNDYRYALTISQAFLIPTGRDKFAQRAQFLGLNANGIEVGYFNDGGPFNWLGDGKDRYFTGSGFFGFYNFAVLNSYPSPNRGFQTSWNELIKNLYLNQNAVKIGFDRFTADEQLNYLMGSFLALNSINPRDTERAKYNNGSTYIKIGLFNAIQAKAQLLGGYDSDVQDFIHSKGQYTKHPFVGTNRFLFGVEVNALSRLNPIKL